RSQEQAPYVHPPDSIEGMNVTGNMLDYTAHMYSSQDQTSARRKRAKRQAKWYAPHPPWLWLLATASVPPCRHRQWDTEALRRPGGGCRGGAPGDTGAKIPFNLPIRHRVVPPDRCARWDDDARGRGAPSRPGHGRPAAGADHLDGADPDSHRGG